MSDTKNTHTNEIVYPPSEDQAIFLPEDIPYLKKALLFRRNIEPIIIENEKNKIIIDNDEFIIPKDDETTTLHILINVLIRKKDAENLNKIFENVPESIKYLLIEHIFDICQMKNEKLFIHYHQVYSKILNENLMYCLIAAFGTIEMLKRVIPTKPNGGISLKFSPPSISKYIKKHYGINEVIGEYALPALIWALLYGNIETVSFLVGYKYKAIYGSLSNIESVVILEQIPPLSYRLYQILETSENLPFDHTILKVNYKDSSFNVKEALYRFIEKNPQRIFELPKDHFEEVVNKLKKI